MGGVDAVNTPKPSATGNGHVEAGRPEDDLRAFRRCLGQFGTGVAVMTAAAEGVRAGVTANSFAAVSLEPPLILWSLAETSRSRPVFERAGHFAVNILGSAQIPLSRRFAGGDGDRFEGLDCLEGEGGVPVLPDCLATLECSIEARWPAGDHTIMLGRVERFSRRAGRPLLFLQGAYGIGDEHPAVQAAARANLAGSDAQEPVLLHLLARAWHRLSDGFASTREAEGISAAAGPILAAAAVRPGLDLALLPWVAGLTGADSRDAAADLEGRGLVTQEGDRLHLTDEGEAVRRRILDGWHRFEAQKLQHLDASDAAALRRALHAILDDIPTDSKEGSA